MADIVSAKTRSRMMAGIKGKDTKPEMVIRSALHKANFRYRLHNRRLPGKPDLVFRKWRAVLFVHGCFWHGHDCHLFKMPKTRTGFWKDKIAGNVARDQKAVVELLYDGWRVGIVWECALKGKTRRPLADIVSELTRWLKGEERQIEIRGTT
ncbi:very short patch repair endonuclease [Roseibium sp. HPY-6]|uniref:very short patch repair endonuclease n=1 Tax=Roseibium sp. HPY-6 TaxID=3229852 RepID=UPI0033900504